MSSPKLFRQSPERWCHGTKQVLREENATQQHIVAKNARIMQDKMSSPQCLGVHTHRNVCHHVFVFLPPSIPSQKKQNKQTSDETHLFLRTRSRPLTNVFLTLFEAHVIFLYVFKDTVMLTIFSSLYVVAKQATPKKKQEKKEIKKGASAVDSFQVILTNKKIAGNYSHSLYR